MSIYWFSGTGNSRAIAEELGSILDETEILPIAQVIASKDIAPAGETAIVVFPVYAFGPPLIVKKFISKMRGEKIKRLYTVATLASIAGAPHRVLRRIAANNRVPFVGGWSLIMPGNYPVFYGAIPEEKQRKEFEKASRKLQNIAETIKNGEKGPIEDSFFPLNLLGSVINSLAGRRFPKEAKKFFVDPGCVKCGICVKVCPVDNVSLKEGEPTWGSRCEQCFACLQWCPKEVIQCGKVTRGRKRYRHPQYKASDFFIRD